MTSLPSRTSLEQLTCFLLLVPGFLYSQVIIREKVEIKPHPALRSTQAACAAEIRVESSFDGEVDPDLPHLIWLKGPCGVDAGSGSVSGSLTAPSYEGIYKAGYRFTNPAGGSGGQFRFAVYLGDSLVREFKTSVSCPTGCTLFDEWTIQLFAGFTFWPQYAVIGSGGTNTFAAVESTSTLTCSPGAWITDWSIELEITKGRDVGSFVDGAKRSYTVVKKKSQFSTFTFVADGEKGYGDVEITARSAGITVVKGFKVIAPLPKVKIVPPWWWYGGPIKLAFDNLPVLEFGEIHTPGPGQKFEPVITWEPDDTINTANYFNLVDELYVKVRAENAGGVARDSVKLVFETECIRANFDPSELSVGDTARLSFQRVKEDGTVEDLPRGLYTFSVTIVAGQDSSRGLFVTDEEEPEGGTTLLNASAPILYIAPPTIPDTEMKVQVIASAWEVMWWKRDEVKGTASAIPNLSVKQAEVEQAGMKLAPAKADLARQITSTSLGAALASGWCPISQVVVKGSPLHHFLVTVQPDTIVHGDTATVYVQAKDQGDRDVDPPSGTLVNVVLGAAEIHGDLQYLQQKGKTVVDIPYPDVKSGGVKFIADGENPIDTGPQTIAIGVTKVKDERIAGTGSVLITPLFEKFCQGDSRWAATKYDNYVRKKKDETGDSTDAAGNKVYYTVGSKGCALTCLAMVTRAGGADIDPGTLAEYMNNERHYGFTPQNGVIWNATDSFPGNGVFAYDEFDGEGLKYKDDKITVDLESSKAVPLDSLDQFLRRGSLIVVQVYNRSTRNGHWVLITAKIEGEYSILDPGCYSGRTNLRNGYEGKIFRYIVYSRN